MLEKDDTRVSLALTLTDGDSDSDDVMVILLELVAEMVTEAVSDFDVLPVVDVETVTVIDLVGLFDVDGVSDRLLDREPVGVTLAVKDSDEVGEYDLDTLGVWVEVPVGDTVTDADKLGELVRDMEMDDVDVTLDDRLLDKLIEPVALREMDAVCDFELVTLFDGVRDRDADVDADGDREILFELDSEIDAVAV